MHVSYGPESSTSFRKFLQNTGGDCLWRPVALSEYWRSAEVSQATQPSGNLKVVISFVDSLWRMQPRRIAAAVLMTILNGFLGGCGILLLLPLLESLNSNSELRGHGVSNFLQSSLNKIGLPPSLEIMIALFLILVGFQTWLKRRLALNGAKLQLAFGQSLKNQMFQSMTCVRWSFFIRQRVSDFIHVLSRDLNRVSHGTVLLLNLLSSFVLVTVHFGLSLLVSPGLSLIVLGTTLLLTPFLVRLNRRATQTGKDYTDRSKSFFHQIEQQLTGMKEIKSLGAETRQVESFKELTRAMHEAELDYTKANTAAGGVFTFGAAALLSGLLLLSVRVFLVPTAELFVLVIIFARLAPQFRQLHSQYQGLLNTMASFRSAMVMQEQLDAESEGIVSRNARSNSAVGTHAGASDSPSIELKDVAFRYDSDDEVWALRNISLTIPASRTTAIVGPSGSGKSTLADLLLGLLPPTSGQLLINGQVLSVNNLSNWRCQIGYVPQETFLLHDSVRANLLLAKPDADDEQLRNAIEAASANIFIDQMPQGLETIIGDRGVRISGGERQRIALARAILRRPDVLILDEATSSLDSENQNRILTAIEQMHGSLTVVMIAHRLSTVRNADRIVVLEHGEIVESGSFDELSHKASGTFKSYLLSDATGRRQA